MDGADGLRDAIAKARARAGKAGPLHADWDLIADAEALLAGKPTLINWGSSEQAIKKLTALLT